MPALINFDHIGRALALECFDAIAARQRMAPKPRGRQKRDDPPHPAAVLILIFPAADDRLHTALTLRATGLRGHSGQVSFPGGRHEPQDESLTATALRETCEEIGLCRERLRVQGQLPPLYIPASHHQVTPIIARCDELPVFASNPAEVAAVFSIALVDLLKPRFKSVERRRIRGVDVRAPFYAVGGHKVWGATAMLLSELEGRLRHVLPLSILREMS